MNNYNYSIHNDLISNFLFLASCVGNYEMGKIEAPEYSVSKKSYIIKNDNLVVLEEVNENKYVYPDLEKVYSILKIRFVNSKPYFEDNDRLILSRFFELNWRSLVKQELYKEVQKRNDLKLLKNRIIASLEELQYRLGLDFTWDLSSSIENGWHLTRNRVFYPKNNEDYTLLENMELLGELDINQEEAYPIQIYKIQDDLNWLKNITKDDISFELLNLHSKASEKDLTNVIIKLLKQNKYFNNQYKEEYSLEIKKLNNYLFSFEKNNISFNLSFIEKEKQLEFVKIYFYCQRVNFITSTKKTIISLFADIFNRGRRSFESINDLIISNEVRENKGVYSYVNDFLLLKFSKNI